MFLGGWGVQVGTEILKVAGLGGIVAPSWEVLGPSWLQVGRSWVHLGSKLGGLRAILPPSWASWCHLGSKLAVAILAQAILAQKQQPWFKAAAELG